MRPHVLRGEIQKQKSPTLICERILQDQAQNIVHPKRVNQQKPNRESFPFCIILLSNCSPWNLTDMIENNRIEKWELFPHSGFFPQWIQFELLIHCQMCNHRHCDNNPLPTVLDYFFSWLTEDYIRIIHRIISSPGWRVSIFVFN